MDVDAGEVDLVGGELPGGQQLLHLMMGKTKGKLVGGGSIGVCVCLCWWAFV